MMKGKYRLIGIHKNIYVLKHQNEAKNQLTTFKLLKELTDSKSKSKSTCCRLKLT